MEVSEAGEKKNEEENEDEENQDEDEENEEAEFENWSPCVVRIAILSSTLEDIIFTKNPPWMENNFHRKLTCNSTVSEL